MAPESRQPAVNAAAFDPIADDVFGRIAGRYDLLCDIFSLGLHRHWKRRMARYIAEAPGARILDTAAGTGDVPLRLARLFPEAVRGRSIVVSDISPAMLAIARRRIEGTGVRPEFRILDAHAMPEIPTGSVDLYSMSLGLKICDRRRALAEAHRVLAPGGTIVTLEASAIRWPWLHRLYLTYMNFCMPLIGRIATGGDASAYLYLLRGVHSFPSAEALAAEMREIGFEDVVFERLTLGIVAIHRARKPQARA